MFLSEMIKGSTSNFRGTLRIVSIMYMDPFSRHQKQLYVSGFCFWRNGPVLGNWRLSIAPAKRVMSLKEPTLKMSKSHADRRSRIILTDSPAEISKKINAALTDSELTITYDPVRRPGVANLIEILSHFDGRTCDEIAMEYRSASLRALKEHLARTLSNHLEPIREKYLSLVGDQTDYLDSIAEQGSEAARANAELTMEQVKVAMGLI